MIDSLTPVVRVCLIVLLSAFVSQHLADQYFGQHVFEDLALFPWLSAGSWRPWQLLTYAIMHTSVTQLVFNALSLVFVGGELERRWGRSRFLCYLIFCTGFAGVTFTVLHPWLAPQQADSYLSGCGAAIFGLLAAYGLLMGERPVSFMMIFPLKAKQLVWGLAGLQLLNTLFTPGGAETSLADLSGMLGGLLFLWVQARILIYRRDRQRVRSVLLRSRSHLRLVRSQEEAMHGDRHSLHGLADPDEEESGPTIWH